MSKVKMLKDTSYNLIARAIDTEHDNIPDDVALRWATKGIAEIIVEEPKGPYDGMKAKELYDLCLSRDIDAEEKQKRNVYLELLIAADEAAVEPGTEDPKSE